MNKSGRDMLAMVQHPWQQQEQRQWQEEQGQVGLTLYLPNPPHCIDLPYILLLVLMRGLRQAYWRHSLEPGVAKSPHDPAFISGTLGRSWRKIQIIKCHVHGNVNLIIPMWAWEEARPVYTWVKWPVHFLYPPRRIDEFSGRQALRTKMTQTHSSSVLILAMLFSCCITELPLYSLCVGGIGVQK